MVDALKLRGSYLVAGELASVYVDISKKHIMPGVNAVERLGLGTDENSNITPAQKSSQILKHARKAQSEISSKAEEVRTGYQKGLDTNNKIKTPADRQYRGVRS